MSSVSASDFRAKVAQMKSWIPNKTPTNRDRLELYALHKQAVASDAPLESSSKTASSSSNRSTSSSKSTSSTRSKSTSASASGKKSTSPAERAKLNAWRTKRGLSQSQAMTAYILEADRQLLVYGTKTTTPTNTPVEERSHSNSNTHTNTNASDNASTTTSNIFLSPRGLAAVPLLCAAASEPRSAYLKRLESNAVSNENGWWMRQEPLCGDPGTIFALPETIVLTIAILIERLSLYLRKSDSGLHDTLQVMGVRPAVIQSLLWPLHNVLLVAWIMVIFLSTLFGSAIVTIQTMLLGSRRTGVSLETIFSQEIRPCKFGTGSLCVSHQASTVRFLGLVLYPLGMICNLSDSVMVNVGESVAGMQTGLLVGSGTFLISCGMLWWYWFIVLPWIAVCGIVGSVCVGWCFGLIELANM